MEVEDAGQDEMTALSLCRMLSRILCLWQTNDYAFCKAEAMPLEKPNAMPSPNPESMPSPNPEAMPSPKGKDMNSQKTG
ncbi:hypothetical protein Tco_0251354 [Tanacetum coccineum]